VQAWAVITWPLSQGGQLKEVALTSSLFSPVGPSWGLYVYQHWWAFSKRGREGGREGGRRKELGKVPILCSWAHGVTTLSALSDHLKTRLTCVCVKEYVGVLCGRILLSYKALTWLASTIAHSLSGRERAVSPEHLLTVEWAKDRGVIFF
jgi:hypothetical protein